MLARKSDQISIERNTKVGNLLINLEILRKEEFAQRRKARIQQVRLQSKDIANKVLRDIRNEKNRQFQLNSAKEDDLFKKWQEKKVSELNLLYKEQINRIGEAQRNAEKEPDPLQEIEERAIKLHGIAKDRGRKAMDQVRKEKENVKLLKDADATRREKVRNIEKMRSTLISSLPPILNNENITDETVNLKEDFFAKSQAYNKKKEESTHVPVEKINSAMQPKIDNICSVSRSKSTTQMSALTSCKSSQPSKQSVAFTVELYDRSNPCTFTKRLPNTVRVERIEPNAWGNAVEAAAEEEKREMERIEKKEKDQKITEERGKKALAKELVRRDFDQLMSRLDGLARKERLARGLFEPHLPVDAYMSESRCAAKAERRQRNMDSVFEGLLFSNQVEGIKKVEETQAGPSVETARIPDDLHPILSDSLPEILNVGQDIKDSDYQMDEENISIENISLKEASESLPASISSKESTQEDRKTADQEKDKDDIPTALPCTGKQTVCVESTKDSDEVDIPDKNTHGLTDERQALIQESETCLDSKDLKNSDEKYLEIDKNSRLSKEDSSTYSSEDTPVKIEAVQVLLRFNESSSPSSSCHQIEECVHSPTVSVKEIGKKKVISWKKDLKMTSDKAVKAVINLKSQDLSTKENNIVQESKLPSKGVHKQQKMRKRNKDDFAKQEKAVQDSPKKPADVIPPSLEDTYCERRAKALLKEVRNQRKQLERLKRKTEPSPVGCYVRKLLSMTRESVEALSVSDVSTPSIHVDSLAQRHPPAEREDIEQFVVEKVDKATSPVPCSISSYNETGSSETSKKLSTSSGSTRQDSFTVGSTSSSSSIDLSHEITKPSASPHQHSPVIHISAPSFTDISQLIPLSSPKYEQLADVHSRRINDLGAQLSMIRESQKRILSQTSSSESVKSSSPPSVISKSSDLSSSSVDSVKINDPLKVNDGEKNWDIPDLSLSAKESSKDISTSEENLLDFVAPLSLPQEVGSVRKKSGTKTGPPPTPLKGLKWSDFDYQIPHELSTITEIDSKLISTLSVLESRKEKDLQPSTLHANEKLVNDESLPKTASKDHPEDETVQRTEESSEHRHGDLVVDNLDSFMIQSSLQEKSSESIIETDKIISVPSLEEKSIVVESISSKSSDDSQFPQTVDDVLRMLGISPTIFNPPASPPENNIQELSIKEHVSLSLHSDSKTNTLEENITVQKDDVEQGSELGKECLLTSESFGKSPFGTSSHHLLHSTPLHSSSGTSSSSSFSKQKNTSGFPFFGESAPSSICSNGTPKDGNSRNLNNSDGAAKKED